MLTLITNNLWIDIDDVVWFRLDRINNKYDIRLRSDPDFRFSNVVEAAKFMMAWENYLIETGNTIRHKPSSAFIEFEEEKVNELQ